MDTSSLVLVAGVERLPGGKTSCVLKCTPDVTLLGSTGLVKLYTVYLKSISSLIALA